MDPQQHPGQLPTVQPTQDFPAPAPGAVQPGQYDFITNPAKPPKKSLFSFGKGDKSSLLIMIAAGFGLLTILLLIGSFFLGGGSDKDALLAVAQKQSEVIAVAEIGEKNAGTNQAQSLAAAVLLNVTTEQQVLLAQLSKNDKVKPKDYAALPSAQVTGDLDTAQRNGRFDEVFNNIMKQELTEYQQELRTANSTVSNKNTKAILAKDYENVGLLLTIPSN